jgi:hypothetical protein
MKKWITMSALAGLVAPFLYLTIYLCTGRTMGEGIFIFWPGSIGLMVLENQPPMFTVIFVWAVAIVSNAVLYSLIGLFFWSVSAHNRRP